MRWLALVLCLAPRAEAETVVAARTIQAQTIIAATDLVLQDGDVSGGESDPALFIGMEARVALYAGRPIRVGDVGFPALVDRNQLVPLVYENNGLLIRTEGRALGRAGAGEMVRVMNMSSRNTVSARIGPDGAAYVLAGADG
ncbi:flagellar basal body P-ring formation chaperone FlgA [Cognatiyoonia koreensis]|nr:flagellar basal body P-ring formation chaperone FlgA [Cognatiyoonia koreensis]